MSEASRAIQRLYEALPWPPSDALGTRQSVLSTSWLTGATFPRPFPVASGRRILVAGSGRGESALTLATSVAGIEVMGVDVSQAAIDAAQVALNDAEERGALADEATVRFARVDVTNAAEMATLGRFDLVICHAVADYVPDRRALLATLAGAVYADGLVYLSANTPDHPAAAVRDAFDVLGVVPVVLEQAVRSSPDAGSGGLTPRQRQALSIAAAGLGRAGGVPELGSLPASVLAADVFPPFAHHLKPDQWLAEAMEAGLGLVGSRVMASAVADVPDDAVPLLFDQSKGKLGALFQRLRRAPSVEMLLAASPVRPPPFDDPVALGSWVPSLDASLPAHTLPAWSPKQPDEPRPLRLQFPGYPEVIVRTTAAALAVLRTADGMRDLNTCAGATGVCLEQVRVSLWRAWVSDLLHLRAP